MSASREKKNRQNQPEVSTVEAPKKGMSKAAKTAIGIVVAIVLVAAIVFLGLVSTGFFEKHSTAAMANGHKLSPAMLNYYYVSGVNEVKQYMGGVMDEETPLDEQEYSGDEYETWADYFMNYAASAAARVYAIYDEAMANGYTLSEEGKISVDNEVQMMDLYAQMYGYGTGDAMLSMQFGSGCNMKNYEEYITVNTIANEYAAKIQNELTYTDADLEAYYAENADMFDAVNYRSFTLTPALLGQEEGSEDAAAVEAAAKAMAEASQGNEEAFLEQAASYQNEEYNAEEATIREDIAYAAAAESYRDWLKEDGRKAGDTTYVNISDNSYMVLYFLGESDHSYQLPNVRHILLSASSTTDEAAMAEAKEKAEAVLAEFQAGEQTEEAFAELAKANSADNAENGGLYENIAPDTMVETFDAWCFDEARQIGDTGIVETEYGYHVMYFSGYGRVYNDYLVENAMRNADFQAWNTEVTADLEYSVNENAKRYMIDL